MTLTTVDLPTPGTLQDAWGTPVNDAINSIVSGLNELQIALGGAATDDATAVAAALGIAAVTRLIVATEVDVPGLEVRGADDSSVKSLFRILDYLGAPILEIQSAFGVFLNDSLRQDRFISDPTTYRYSDIYGFQIVNGGGEFTWAGPPGNLLTFPDACQELFQSSRSGTVGNWTSLIGGTVAVATSTTNPAYSRNVINVTSPGGGVVHLVGQTGTSGIPCSPGDVLSSIFHTRAANGSAHDCQAGFRWYDSGGSFLSQSLGSLTPGTTSTTYAKIPSGGLTAPASTAYAAPVLYIPGATASQQHRVSAIGAWRGTQTVWAPPFVAQPRGLTGGQAVAGDRWWRTDTPSTSNQRLYICTTGGIPRNQVWSGIL